MFQAGSIVGQITASVSPLKAAFSNALGETQKFAGSFGGALLAAGAALGGLAGAIHAVQSSMEQIDAQAKSADAIGMSTEAFAALSHQANLAGADMAQVSMSLSRMQGRLVEAAQGSKTAQDAFAALGVNVDQLIELPAEEAFGRLGDAMADIENPAERARAAAEIFGERAGPRLMALLMEGSAGIAAAKREAEALGLTFSRIDAAQVEEANDAISRIGASLAGMGRSLAIAIAPAVEVAADAIRSLAGIFRPAIDAVGALTSAFGSLDPILRSGIGQFTRWSLAMGAGLLVGPRIVSMIVSITRALRAMASGQALVSALAGPGGWANLAASIAVFTGTLVAVDHAFAGVEAGANSATQAVSQFVQAGVSMGDDFSNALELAKEAVRQRALAQGGQPAAVAAATTGITFTTPEIQDPTFDILSGLQSRIDELKKSRRELDLAAVGNDERAVAWVNRLHDELEQADLDQKIKQTTDALREQIATFGMSDVDKSVFDFQTALPDASQTQVAEFRRLAEQIDELQKGKDLTAEIDQWKESLEGPKEQYQEIVDKLMEWRRLGKITQEELDAGLAKAEKDLRGPAKQSNREPQFASLINRNSAEELRLRFAAQSGSSEIPREQLSVAKKSDERLGELVDWFKTIGVA